jgi:mRNA interferase MazF
MTVSNPTDFNPGDVILLSYPFGEGAGVRKRPALVVSSSVFNQETGELVVAQITSRVSAPARAGDYAIADWREAKLPRPALVRARLATLARSLVLRRLGSLSEADYQGALAAIKSQLGG